MSLTNKTFNEMVKDAKVHHQHKPSECLCVSCRTILEKIEQDVRDLKELILHMNDNVEKPYDK